MSSIRKVCVAAVLATVANQGTNAVQLKGTKKWIKYLFPTDKSSSSDNFIGFVKEKVAKKEQKAIKKTQEAIEKAINKTQLKLEAKTQKTENAFKKIDKKRKKAEKKMEDARNASLKQKKDVHIRNLVQAKRFQNAVKKIKERRRINNAHEVLSRAGRKYVASVRAKNAAKISAKNAADVVYGSQLVNEAMQLANAALKTSANAASNAALKTSAFEAFKNALAEAGLPDVEEETLKKGFESMFHSTDEYEKIVSDSQAKAVADEDAQARAEAAAADKVTGLNDRLSAAQEEIRELKTKVSNAQAKAAADEVAKARAEAADTDKVTGLRKELCAAQEVIRKLRTADSLHMFSNLKNHLEKLNKDLDSDSQCKVVGHAKLHVEAILNAMGEQGAKNLVEQQDDTGFDSSNVDDFVSADTM